MDWIQFPFEVNARVHLGAGAPIVRLRWVYTDQPFLPPGTQSVVNNRIWNEDQDSELPVGQLPLDASQFKQDERWRLPAGMRPGHMCHPEWLATGEPWPTALPPAVYGPFWIPECCGLFQDQPAGGLVVGGEAGDVHDATDATAGGLVVGGECGDVHSYADPAAGGLVVGGAAGDSIAYADATAGGVVVGGEVGDLQSHVDPTAGGVVVGGEAGDMIAFADPSAGGLEVGGEVGDVWENGNDPTEGGLVVGGEAGDDYTPPASDLFVNGTFDDTRPTYICDDFLIVEWITQEASTAGGAFTEIEAYFECESGWEPFFMWWLVGTTPYAGDVASLTGAPAFVFVGVAPSGRDIFRITFAISGTLPAGTTYFTCRDTFDSSGANPMRWFAASGGTFDAESSVSGTIAGGMVIVVR